MRILLDTNIIIHREASKVINPDIGYLFQWLDKLKLTKCIHPLTVEELNRNKDSETVETMNIKIGNYHLLKTQAPFEGAIAEVSSKVDINENDLNDSKILNEVYSGRVDILISEDKKIHTKAALLNISEKVFKIDAFLEKATAENPDFVDYKILAVKKLYFGKVNLADPFFDSFREDYQYPPFDGWFKKKSDEISYVCFQDDTLSAFLFIKIEDENENYSDISPSFTKKKRLKIGTFKITSNGYKIGERFLKIIFDNALKQKVNEIYVTIFDKRPEQERLISLLEEWGFKLFGIKSTKNGDEKVYVREFDRVAPVNLENPKLTYPFISKESSVFIVPIYPAYHTELFPDSILRTESPKDFVENEPHRNALSKVYISRSHERNLNSGDLIVFYRTGDPGNAIHTGVVTTVGIVESVITDIKDEASFLALCRKRSVFTDEELKKHWNYYPRNKPFIVNFLYAFSYPKRPNLKWLNENGVIPNILDMPRGFRKITREDFNNIAKYSFNK
ncbi:MAG: PIN domain-containing protein [Bacteroidota bacterium]